MADQWLPTRLAREAAVRAGELRVAAAARQALTALTEAMAGVYSASGVLDNARMDSRSWQQSVDDVLLPVIGAVFAAAWEEQAAAVTEPRLTAAGFRDVLDKADLSPDAATSAHLATVRNRLVGVSDGVFDLIREQVEVGRLGGEDIPSIAARVDDVLIGTGTERWANRATVIARTETIGAYNAGHVQGTTDAAAAFGIEPAEVVRVWLATADGRTRDSHADADGQQVVEGEPFDVGGAPLDYPGDPAGPPEEVIQCRCTLQFLMPGDEGYPEPPEVTRPALARDDFSDPTTPRTRAVGVSEYEGLLTKGEQQYRMLQSTATPPAGLDANWSSLVDDAYDVTRSEWGGMTVNAHTGAKVAADANSYAITAKPPGLHTVSVPASASKEQITAAMNEARRRFDSVLSYDQFHLGVFRDDAIDRIDFDPVLVVDSIEDVESLGLHTNAVGGAYHFADGNGYWPPYLNAASRAAWAKRHPGLVSSLVASGSCTDHPCTCRGCDEFDCGMDACSCCWVYADDGETLIPEEGTMAEDDTTPTEPDCEGREPGDPEYGEGCDEQIPEESLATLAPEDTEEPGMGEPGGEGEPTEPDCQGRAPGDEEYGVGCDPADPTQPVEVSESADADLVAMPDDGPMFHGVLAPEDTYTGDSRYIGKDALGWRDLPIPMKVQVADEPGHDGSVRFGRIDRVWRDATGPVTKIRYEGTYATTSEGTMTEIAQATSDEVEARVLRGVSVDMDDVTMEYLNPENGQAIDPMDEDTWPDDPMTEPVMAMVYGRISAATACSIPAYQEAYIANGPYVEGEPEPGDDSWPNPGEGRDPGPGPVEAIAASALVRPPMLTLVASYERPVYAAADFMDPGLVEATPLTVTDDGRVYGHLASWGTCHIGFDGMCVTPPYSATNYAHYRTGSVMTDDGEIATGPITIDTGHANIRLGARPAAAHYDNTGHAVADVAMGEDSIGIWCAGRVRPTATAEQVETLRLAGALSGDWRTIGGNLELVAALGVNTPGFPIPRVRAAAAAGRQVGLVAAGMVIRQAPTHALVAAAIDHDVVARQVLALMDRRARVDRLARSVGRDKDSRLAAVLASMGMTEV